MSLHLKPSPARRWSAKLSRLTAATLSRLCLALSWSRFGANEFASDNQNDDDGGGDGESPRHGFCSNLSPRGGLTSRIRYIGRALGEHWSTLWRPPEPASIFLQFSVAVELGWSELDSRSDEGLFERLSGGLVVLAGRDNRLTSGWADRSDGCWVGGPTVDRREQLVEGRWGDHWAGAVRERPLVACAKPSEQSVACCAQRNQATGCAG